MQSKDLRIGNYVYDSAKKIHQITSINDLKIGLVGCSIEFRFAEPIRLTETIIIDLGFEKHEFAHKENQYRYKDRLIVLREGKFVDYGSSVIVEYVHELQNLYFALTGEELEFVIETKP
jgi:hypothetical protein